MTNKELKPLQEAVDGLLAELGENASLLENAAVKVEPESVLSAAEYLLAAGYEFLADITAVDYLAEGVFRLLYQVANYQNGDIITVKTDIPRERAQIASVTGVWRSADWLEREVYDMFGIEFTGHPNLQRILMWEGFDGWPLRRDFVHKPTEYQGRRRLD